MAPPRFTHRRLVLLCLAGALLMVAVYLGRPYAKEYAIKRTISQASSVSFVFPSEGGSSFSTDKEQGFLLVTIKETEPKEVAALAEPLLSDARRYDAGWEKCFEGLERNYDKWPRAVFRSAKGQPAVIYLPLGDCGVWPEGLPWGWDYGAQEFIHMAQARMAAARASASKNARLSPPTSAQTRGRPAPN